MCGINGIIQRDGEADPRHVARMNDALFHRGPDEGGVASLGRAAIGMRRLSILDLAGGHQPMATADGRWTMVYNGELYDSDVARRRLEAGGATFRTTSDTEVLLELYAARGLACLDELNGMFAFAVYDRDEETLTIARDPIGIKPLFYWVGPKGELVFSSELASLVAHPLVPRRLDPQSLAMLLVDRCIGDPWTLFEGVQQLPPGHALRWRDGQIEVTPYWQLKLAPEPLEERAALAELRDLLEASVRSQLVADVPVGVFLSGGIDSSTVAALAARAKSEPIHSFNVGFASPEFDESEVARAVAQHIGSTHHELRVENACFDPTILDTVVDHVGQPLGDLSCIPTYLVSRFARQEVTVILSGDGGDEFFGGYDHMHWAAQVQRVQARTPAVVRRIGQLALAGASTVAVGERAVARTRRARKGLDLTFCTPMEQMRRMMSLWSEDEARELLAARDARALRPAFFGDPSSLEGLEPEEFAMAVLAQSYMTSAILTKVDRMSMAASLEVRVPLLDRRVVEFALRCPLALKVRGRQGKYLLREAGRPYLPEAVYSHPKKGFGLPLHAWFNGEFWDLLDSLYAPGTAAASLFEPRALRRTIEAGRRAHRAGRGISSQTAAGRVWLLAQLGRWMQRFQVAA
ncbi:MAG: asparagine synthase (glutamine-hydrolyzing) [Planctomycetota bacterium]